MNRVRWFEAVLPTGLRSFAGKLEAMPITRDGHMGFRLERVRKERIEAVYYERFSWTDQRVDPFGVESAIERIDYKTVRFSVSKEYPQLEFVDPPRGLSSFFSRIAEVTDFATTVTPLAVDVPSWTTALRESAGLKFTVSGITVSNLNVEDNVTGRLTVASNHKDVGEALARLLSRRTYSVQKMQLSMQGERTHGSVVISSDGSVRSQRGLGIDILESLRQTIPPHQP